MENIYEEDREFTEEELQRGVHRQMVGGLWDELGELQLNICKKYGLQPEHKLLDFGCGCLRGGVKFIPYLNASNYYGMDSSYNLMCAGIEIELPNAGLTGRVNLDNFLISDKYEIHEFQTLFDFIFAQSVFTHLNLNHLIYFLEKCYYWLQDDGKIILSIFLCEEFEDFTEDQEFVTDVDFKTSFLHDAYHYKFSLLKLLTEDKWNITLLEDNHPRMQRFVMLTKK